MHRVEVVMQGNHPTYGHVLMQAALVPPELAELKQLRMSSMCLRQGFHAVQQ